MTESEQGRPPVDESRPSSPDPDREGASPDPGGSGVGMGLGQGDAFEPEESDPADDTGRE
jgi:hypothetical protein